MTDKWPEVDEGIAFLFDDKPADPTPPSVKGSATSKAAADQIKPSAAGLRAKVLQYLEDQSLKGATDDEIQVALDMNPSTQRPRRIELVEAGAVKDSGSRRQTRSGRNAAVWVAVPLALRDGQQAEVKAKGPLWQELRKLIEGYTADDLRWLIGIVKQKDVRQAMPTAEEIEDQLDILDADDEDDG